MRRASAATVAVALLLVGCSGGPAPSPSGPTSGTTTPAASPSTSQTHGGSSTPAGPTASSGVPTSPAPSSSAPQSLPTPSDDSLHPWLTGPSEREPAPMSGQEIIGVRTGLHDGYDRVVLDLSGDDPELGWFVAFTDEAVEDPSGRALDVEGSAFLQLGIRGIDWTTDAPERYSGETVAGGALDVVSEVVFGGLFEGQQQVVIGLEASTAYRVFALSDPARIVIDVRHP